MDEDEGPIGDERTRTPAYAVGEEATHRPSYAQPADAVGDDLDDEGPGMVQLLTLYDLTTNRRLRLEAPTVFGRSHTFFRYPDEEQRFTEDDASELERLDYVRIRGEGNLASRTHGVLDPKRLCIRDLNSKNGIEVNGTLIPRVAGHPGPPYPVSSDDQLKIGDVELFVKIEHVHTEELLRELARTRNAFVGPSSDPEADKLGSFLGERKRFFSRSCDSWSRMLEVVSDLRYTAQALGILVLGLVVEPLGGDRLRFGKEEVSLDVLLFAIADLPGSKVIALQATGDPSGLESAFRDLAFQDTILLTSTVSSEAGLDPDALVPEIGTAPVEAMRRSVAQGRGTFDSVLDGLDALVRPESNVLEVDWVERYEGTLRLVVGTRERAEDFEVELSYQPSDPSEGSFRVRHDLSRRGKLSSPPTQSF